VILGSLKNAFMTEVMNRVDLDQFGTFLTDSPALSRIKTLALEQVSSYDVLGGVFTGTLKGMGQEGSEIKKELKNGWTSTRIFYDGLRCGLEGLMIISLAGAPLAGSNLTPCTNKGVKRIWKGIKNTGGAAVKEGAKIMIIQSAESLKKNQDEAQTQLMVLSQDALQNLSLDTKLQSFWMSIQTNQSLKRHIIDTYGDATWTHFQNALKEWMDSPKLDQKINELSGEIKILGQQGLKVLLLDREGKGPNPLLLAVIQEQLQGSVRPVVHVVFGSKELIQPGYQFTHQDEVH
jgi:hypothetical protein